MTVSLAQNPFFFFPVALFVSFMALGVLFSASSIKALLYLVMSMLGVGLVFLSQGALFLGGVQFAVYAGAVMVLFLMVLMLIEDTEISDAFFREKASLEKFVKVGAVGIFLGLSMGAFSLKTYTNSYKNDLSSEEATKELAVNLFENHMFLFEIVGVLLLVIAVAVVSVSRMKEKSQ